MTTNIESPETSALLALFEAIEQENIDVVRTLIAQGTPINDSGSSPYTPLMRAAENHITDIAEFLIEKGAEINKKTRGMGTTALMRAANNGCPEMIALLLKHGADIHAKNKNLETPLMIAGQFEYPKSVALLIDRGAKLDEQDIQGYTVLMTTAVNQKLFPIAKILIEKGADLDIKASDGTDALVLATQCGNMGVAALIQKARVDRQQQATEKARIEAEEFERSVRHAVWLQKSIPATRPLQFKMKGM